MSRLEETGIPITEASDFLMVLNATNMGITCNLDAFYV
jgi:hypothetical protein